MNVLHKSLLIIVVLSSLGFFFYYTAETPRTSKLLGEAEDYLVDFFDEDREAIEEALDGGWELVIDQDPIRNWDEAENYYLQENEEGYTAREVLMERVFDARETRNDAGYLAQSEREEDLEWLALIKEQFPRDIVMERSEREKEEEFDDEEEAEESRKRAWFDNDEPGLILGTDEERRAYAQGLDSVKWSYEDVLEKLPVDGEAVLIIDKEEREAGWSNDYWALKYGSLAIRYGQKENYRSFAEAFNFYRQPDSYFKTLSSNDNDVFDIDLTSKWSPAEKYDLLMGDTNFSLTNFLKEEPLQYADYDPEHVIKKDGKIVKITGFNKDVASWMGKCHGWAAAATVEPKVTASAEYENSYGDWIWFAADDIRGLITLKWAQTRYQSLFVGGRCNQSFEKDEVNIDRNSGAIKDQKCFDVNPGTMRTVLSNYTGIQKKMLVMDATFDAEVWNHPIKSYKIIGYFNPDTQEIFDAENYSSIPMAAYADYGFSSDKFGVIREEQWQQAHKSARRWMKHVAVHGKEFRPSHVAGEIMEVSYLVETQPNQEDPYEDQVVKVVYIYDLELDVEKDKEGSIVASHIVGGEWYQNKHPDFLWAVPEMTRPLNQFDTALINDDVYYDGSVDSLDEILAFQYRDKSFVELSSARNGEPLYTILDLMIAETSE